MGYDHLSREKKIFPADGWCTLAAYSQAVANLLNIDPESAFRMALKRIRDENFKHSTEFGEISLFSPDGSGLDIYSEPIAAKRAIQHLFNPCKIDAAVLSTRNNEYYYEYMLEFKSPIAVDVSVVSDDLRHKEQFDHSVCVIYFPVDGFMRIHDCNLTSPLDYDPKVLLEDYISTGIADYNYQHTGNSVAFFLKHKL